MDRVAKPRASIIEGALWMVGLSVLLFFVPLLNGFIGGLVGGYRVGGVGRAMAAAFMPAVFASILLWFLFSIVGLPVVGFFAGAGAALLVVLLDVGIFIGAAVGGALGRMEHQVPAHRRLEA